MTKELHRPPHIYKDDTWYFITAHTHNDQAVMQYPGHKQIWLDALHTLAESFSFRITAWVALDNHYHLLIHVSKSQKLGRFINHLNGRTSFLFNKVEGLKGRKVWYSYWDRIIRDETDFWTKFNYIHYNPVKHGYVADPIDWEFSSYRNYYTERDFRWLESCWEAYPVSECHFE